MERPTFAKSSKQLFSRAFGLGIDPEHIRRSAQRAAEASRERREAIAGVVRPGGLEKVTIVDLVRLSETFIKRF